MFAEKVTLSPTVSGARAIRLVSFSIPDHAIQECVHRLFKGTLEHFSSALQRQT
jgi:hypothetical protein